MTARLLGERLVWATIVVLGIVAIAALAFWRAHRKDVAQRAAARRWLEMHAHNMELDPNAYPSNYDLADAIQRAMTTRVLKAVTRGLRSVDG